MNVYLKDFCKKSYIAPIKELKSATGSTQSVLGCEVTGQMLTAVLGAGGDEAHEEQEEEAPLTRATMDDLTMVMDFSFV